MDRQQWLVERKKGIGSSAAPIICGLSPYRTPLSLYQSYTAGADDERHSSEMTWGMRLEPLVARCYSDETGLQLRKPEMLLRHPEHDWMLASLDYETANTGCIVEIKTTRFGDGYGEPGTDEVPEHVLIQTQHQMAVAGREQADIAVLIAGSDFRIYSLRRRDDIIDSLIKIESEFWRRVTERRPPEPDWEHPETPGLIEKLYVPVSGTSITLDASAEALADEYLALTATARDSEKAKAIAKAKLVALMGTASAAVLPSGRVVTRKMVSRGSYQVAASEYAQLRIGKAKE